MDNLTTSLENTEQTDEIGFFISFNVTVKSYQTYIDISELPKICHARGKLMTRPFFLIS